MKKLCIFIFLAAVTQACSAQIETFPAFESCSIYLKIENPDSKLTNPPEVIIEPVGWEEPPWRILGASPAS